MIFEFYFEGKKGMNDNNFILFGGIGFNIAACSPELRQAIENQRPS